MTRIMIIKVIIKMMMFKKQAVGEGDEDDADYDDDQDGDEKKHDGSV